jgi:hypothetical protein
MAPLSIITKAVSLIGKLHRAAPEAIPHTIAFIEALVDGDQKAAERAATSAATARIFRAPVKR